MTGDLLRIRHGTVAGHDLVLRREYPAGFKLATVMTDHGMERVLHVVHLKVAELPALAKALIDVLATLPTGSPLH